MSGCTKVVYVEEESDIQSSVFKTSGTETLVASYKLWYNDNNKIDQGHYNNKGGFDFHNQAIVNSRDSDFGIHASQMRNTCNILWKRWNEIGIQDAGSSNLADIKMADESPHKYIGQDGNIPRLGYHNAYVLRIYDEELDKTAYAKVKILEFRGEDNGVGLSSGGSYEFICKIKFEYEYIVGSNEFS